MSNQPAPIQLPWRRYLRLPRVQFTTRRMMIGVGVLAVLMAVGTWWMRTEPQAAYARKARAFSSLEKRYLELSRKPSSSASMAARMADAAAYVSKLRGKYERAARYPWLPLEPDPPHRRSLKAKKVNPY